MLKIKGMIFIAVLFLVMVFLTGEARLVLDEETAGIGTEFEEMIYLPRGAGLKIIACGFDAPLADALFIRGLIYYAESFERQQKDIRREYTYELFDVITDLSPRFTRAYHLGGVFLSGSSSIKSNYDGIALLQKGADHYAQMARDGIPVLPDGRWLFHTLIANTYETTIQYHMRNAGDKDGAAEARRHSADHFRMAAASPGAPQYVIDAAAGLESLLSGQGSLEESKLTVRSVWAYLYEQAEERGDEYVMEEMASRINEIDELINNISFTRVLEEELTKATTAYEKDRGKVPEGIFDLLYGGYLKQVPIEPLSDSVIASLWLVLPDALVKSAKLAALDSELDMDVLIAAVIEHRKATSRPAESPEELIRDGYIDTIPVPPLAALGQEYRFDPESGTFKNIQWWEEDRGE